MLLAHETFCPHPLQRTTTLSCMTHRLGSKGAVAFGSGPHGLRFNAERFAKIYASKVEDDKEKMAESLWGDIFCNAEK